MAELEATLPSSNTVLEPGEDNLQKQALEQFRTWATEPPLRSQPRIAKTLNHGSGHTALLIIASNGANNQSYILRYRNPTSTPLGLAFEQEISGMQIAHCHGLAPQIVWLDRAQQSMVLEFLSESGPVSCGELAALVRAIHRLPAELPRLDLQHQFEHYWHIALQKSNSSSALINPAEPALQLAIAALESEPAVMCHNDLTPPNIRRRNNDLVAIDWEYAATGSPHFDIATLCAGWPDLNAESLALDVLGDRFSQRLFGIATHLYAALNWNWQRAADEAHDKSQSSAQLLQRLDECL